MRLGEVLANSARLVRGSPELAIDRVSYDSRDVKPGTLFCALAGTKADGAKFVADALARGATAVLAGKEIEGEFPLAIAADPRRAMAQCAAQLGGWPASKLTVLGVTGTNGKTTTAYLVEEMARAAGRRTGLIGTVEQRVAGVSRPSTHTTPESVDLQRLLAEMVRASVEVVAMEVSSHALAQSRVVGIRYGGAAFTNLTRDHLDFHGTMEAYLEAKSLLFTEHLARAAPAVLNAADPHCVSLGEKLRTNGRTTWMFGTGEGHELSAVGATLSLAGFTTELRTPAGSLRVKSPLVGLHNVQNALAASGLAIAAGIPLSAIADALATSRGAPGRLEPVLDASGRLVFVDYAHTDDALSRVLAALREQATGDTRVITVFGCGGDRDPGKRPLMGLAAARASDIVVATSDNPRTENPSSILDAIVPGLVQGGRARVDVSALFAGSQGFTVIEDRAEAIRTAVGLARPGDVVLIAGKGHEDYQVIGTEKRHFDDREQARAALAAVPARSAR